MKDGPVSAWSVHRHGGMTRHKWRLIAGELDEAHARELYARESDSMRQGGVKLCVHDNDGRKEGRTVESQWVPAGGLKRSKTEAPPK